jgi:glyoxylase-like metal-dependent hydrolase (beta-lactamase superfamily II)
MVPARVHRIVGALMLLVAAFAGLRAFSSPQPGPNGNSVPPDATTLRKMAQDSAVDAESLPLEIRVLELARCPLSPAAPTCARRPAGRERSLQAYYSFQLAYRDSSVVIDTGPDREWLAARGCHVNDEAVSRLDSELSRARMILTTSESREELGGYASSPRLYDFRDRLHLTRAQAESARIREAGIPPAVLEALRWTDQTGAAVVLPGVVVISAPGASPGARWIYVRLQANRELLLSGSTAATLECLKDNWRPTRIEAWFSGGDAGKLAVDLQRLRNLAGEMPVLPAHDEGAVAEHRDAGLLETGFIYRSNFVITNAARRLRD